MSKQVSLIYSIKLNIKGKNTHFHALFSWTIQIVATPVTSTSLNHIKMTEVVEISPPSIENERVSNYTVETTTSSTKVSSLLYSQIPNSISTVLFAKEIKP